MNAREALTADRKHGAEVQDRVNRSQAAWSDAEAAPERLALDELCELAEQREDSERYPQYRGHFNGWTLAQVTQRVRTKAGVAFEAGDFSVMQRRGDDVFVYSFRNGVTTLVGGSRVRELDAPWLA